MWLFLLVTPVQFIGGWSFYVGTWQRSRRVQHQHGFPDRARHHGGLCLQRRGAVLPEVLPIKVEERDVYFEVSAVIIAFVLLGKYMEEIIKKRSSSGGAQAPGPEARDRPRRSVTVPRWKCPPSR